MKAALRQNERFLKLLLNETEKTKQQPFCWQGKDLWLLCAPTPTIRAEATLLPETSSSVQPLAADGTHLLLWQWCSGRDRTATHAGAMCRATSGTGTGSAITQVTI